MIAQNKCEANTINSYACRYSHIRDIPERYCGHFAKPSAVDNKPGSDTVPPSVQNLRNMISECGMVKSLQTVRCTASLFCNRLPQLRKFSGPRCAKCQDEQ